jgi:hypothetical protein
VNERYDEGLSHVAALMREHAGAPVEPELDRSGRVALEQRLRAAPVGTPRRTRPLLVAAAALAATIAFAFVELRPRPVRYEVRGAPSDGPYVSAPSASPVTVAFSDGSSLEADPGSRLRVEEARVTGARVLLERGTAKVHVEHHASSAWNFVAGPFDVHVTGTRFELSWDPTGEAVDLRLVEGSVEVRGPFAEAPIAVRAGQRFRADLGSRSMTVIDALQPAAATNAPPLDAAVPRAAAISGSATPAPLATREGEANEHPRADVATKGELEAKPAAHAEATARALATSRSAESWSVLVARGQFETVVAKAGERGASECERACSAADLKALADAARYTGRSGMAESALLSLRRRFGGTREGRSAAFLLGRLEEARGATAAAERWYDTYLRELPAGDLAAEALAGKMRTVFASNGRAAATPLASEYLTRYPNGVHAQTARGILGQDSRNTGDHSNGP